MDPFQFWYLPLAPAFFLILVAFFNPHRIIWVRVLARGARRPIGKIADVKAPPPFNHVVEREAFPAGTADLEAEADHLVVHENRRLSAAGRGRFHEAVCQLYPHHLAIPSEPPR
jgi:hypothetical protein